MLVCIFADYDFFEGRPHDVELEHRRRINMQMHERFRIRDLNDPLAMSVPEFRRLFRMTQDAAVRLRDVLLPHVQRRTNPLRTSLLRKVCRCAQYVNSFFQLCVTF